VVLYHGRALEIGPSGAVFDAPLHPYTVALRRAVLPVRRHATATLEPIALDTGVQEAPARAGCIFVDRCPQRFEPCASVRPGLKTVEPGRRVACHLFDPTRTGPDRAGAGRRPSPSTE
jgi:oligopeptide/dipeptide ABC transporter ATP-binding protein